MSTLATLLRIDCRGGKIKAERQVRKYYRTQRRDDIAFGLREKQWRWWGMVRNSQVLGIF